nr:hypothetical protein [bacterium]
MKKRQAITTMAAIGMVLSALAGCAGPSASPSPGPDAIPKVEPGPSVSPTPEKVVDWPAGIDFSAMAGKRIVIYSGYSDDEEGPNPEKELREEFSRRFGVELGKMFIPPDKVKEILDLGGGRLGIMQYAYATGKSPTIWGEMEGYPWLDLMPRAAIMGLVQPVDQWLDPKDNTFIPSVWQANMWQGKPYCLQYFEGLYAKKGEYVEAVVYNLTELEKYGVEDPLDSYLHGEWTWNKMRSISRMFNQPNAAQRATAKGFAVTDNVIGGALALNGGSLYQVVDGQYQMTLHQAQSKEILAMLADAVRSGDFRYEKNQESAGLRKNNMFYGMWFVAQRTSPYEDKMQAVPLPMAPSDTAQAEFCIRESYYMIGANSPNPDVGFAWLWYCGNYYTQQDSSILSWPEELAATLFNGHTQKMVDMFEEALKTGDQLVVTTNLSAFPGLREHFTQCISQLMEGKQGLDELLNQYEPRMQSCIDAVVFPS